MRLFGKSLEKVGPTHRIDTVCFKKIQSDVDGKECIPCSFPSSFTEEDADFPIGIFGIYISIMTIQLAAVLD